MAAPNRGIPLCLISPRYLHTNSTSHTWPFGAIAELIDNAYDPDVSAETIWINKTEVKGLDCLTFTDNGNGMDYDKMHKMLSFGFSDKQTVRGHIPVGLYGNGFKSGSMRLGKDAIVFSKNSDTMCVGLLSQTYLEKIGAQNIKVPIVIFTGTNQTVSAAPEDGESLCDILKYSLFNTKEELLSGFRDIDKLCTNSSGTHIIIWNLRRRSSGELEFDFKKDPYDIKIPVDMYTENRETPKWEAAGGVSVPESEYSLRAYCSILYLKPRIKIILQGRKVKTLHFPDTLATVYMDKYKPACFKKGTEIIFGYNTKSKEHYGLMMYHKNRLIKAYVRVPCQRKADNTGEGVIGVIECDYLKPTHNKQDFDDTQDYRNTMTNVSKKLKDYWNNYRYTRTSNTVKQSDQTWIHCDDCLKWRKLPNGFNDKNLPQKWLCSMNPDPQFRSYGVAAFDSSEDEQPRYPITYKKHKRTQKLQQNRQRVIQKQDKAARDNEMRPSDDTSPNSQEIVLPPFLKRKKTMDLNQEKARRIGEEEEEEEEEEAEEEEEKDNYSLSIQHPHTSHPSAVTDVVIPESTEHCADSGVYRFLCTHAGQFHCKLTNLVFEMKGKGDVRYKVVSWDNSQLESKNQFQPAGPLYSIDCSEGSIIYLHLPHCEIHTAPCSTAYVPNKNQIELAVAHFREGNVEDIQPLKVTNAHVIIEVQNLSLFGLHKKWIFQETPISAQVLFYQKMELGRKLHIYLLPGNVPLKEVQNQHEGDTFIKCSSICQLTPGEKYRPLCEPYESHPKVQTFSCDFGPNYHPTFEVILDPEAEDLTLSILDEIGQDVWEPHQVFLTADREAVPVRIDQGAEFVDEHRDMLI